MSISSDTEGQQQEDTEHTRDQSPPVPPDTIPPSTLRLHSLPAGAQIALGPPRDAKQANTAEIMGADTPSISPLAAPAGSVDREMKPKSRERDSKKVESVDYAYEYVPVVQRRENRKDM